MPKFLCIAFILFTFSFLNAQFKNDNVLYRTVYAQDLNTQLKLNPGFLLLDVRSKGEYSDTASMTSMNLGHLNNAKNIDVRELGSRINEINEYKNKPIFVYCSHSQRSRRASKMLADSGFTNVFNINGGMTTFIQTPGSVQGLYQTINKYSLLSPADLCREIDNKNNYIVDIRSDSAYRGISSSPTLNTMGRIRNAINVPSDSLEGHIRSLPHDKKIILFDKNVDFLHKKIEEFADILKA